jgi:hypothetical protein
MRKQERVTNTILQKIIVVTLYSSENEESVCDGRAVTGRATKKINKWKEYISHSITVFWRLVFAVIPPECKRCLCLKSFIKS